MEDNMRMVFTQIDLSQVRFLPSTRANHYLKIWMGLVHFYGQIIL